MTLTLPSLQLSYFQRVFAVSLAYFITAKIGLYLVVETISLFWISSGIVALAIIIEKRLNKSCFSYMGCGIAYLLAIHTHGGYDWPFSLGLLFANMLEWALMKHSIRYFDKDELNYQSIRNLFRLMALFLMAPLLSGFVAAHIVQHFIPAVHWPTVWMTWCIGDLFGILITIGIFFGFYQTAFPNNKPKTLSQKPYVLWPLSISMILTAFLVFPIGYQHDSLIPEYFLFIPVIITSILYGIKATASITSFYSIVGITHALILMTQTGAQIGGNHPIDPRYVLDLQIFFILICFSGYIISSILYERDAYFYKLEESNKALRHRSETDSLTGIPNRTTLMAQLNKGVALQKTPLSLLFLDLDGFKEVNDRAGHEIGDQVLTQSAQRILSCVRSRSTVARFGGDEFVVLLHLNDPKTLKAISKRIINTIRHPFSINGTKYHIGASIGIARFPYDAQDAETLVKCADMAMYMAKKGGKGKLHFYDPILFEATRRQLSIKVELRKALENREFELAFQTQWNTKNNQATGIEALLRWKSPILGLMKPSEFIPCAEKSGDIANIDHWVLKEACHQFRQLCSDQPADQPALKRCDLKLCVNVSSETFKRGRLVNSVKHALKRNQLSAGQLELEITERLFMETTSEIHLAFAELRQMGVRFAIDDFGIGYSSLSYLHRFSFNTIKVDKSFIQKLPDDTESFTIIKAIAAMASSLGISIVMEGIETQQQLDSAQKLGCQTVQGFFLCKPLGLRDITKKLRSTQPVHPLPEPL